MPTESDSSPSPLQPLSYASPGIVEPRNQFMVTPVGWPLAAFALILTGLSFYSVSGPSAYFFASAAACVGWIAAMGWWGIKTTLCLFRGARAYSRIPHVWLKLPAAPLLLLITVILVHEDVPSRAAFFVARPSMERIARAQLQTPDGTNLWANVSVYGRCQFTHDGNAVTIRVPDAGFIDSWGFAYCPAGPLPAWGSFSPMGGSWYRWFCKF